jgi:hypothetical protein
MRSVGRIGRIVAILNERKPYGDAQRNVAYWMGEEVDCCRVGDTPAGNFDHRWTRLAHSIIFWCIAQLQYNYRMGI